MTDSNVKQEQREMGFFDHLGELRIRLIYSLLGLAVASAVAGYYIDFIMDQLLLKPALIAKITLQNLKVFGQPVLYFKVIVMVGIILSFPFTAYQIWKFVEPALYSNEKGWARKITFFTTLCFVCGVAFSYFVMIPSMLAFSSGFGSSNIKNIVDINEYWSFLTLMILAAGFFFELPMISFVLSKIGMLTPRFLRKYRRHSIVIILLVSAIITPSPDPVNQMIVAIPIYILYEISIIVSKLSLKKTIEES
jgi:sec-independent protein translocase protein TatC